MTAYTLSLNMHNDWWMMLLDHSRKVWLWTRWQQYEPEIHFYLCDCFVGVYMLVFCKLETRQCMLARPIEEHGWGILTYYYDRRMCVMSGKTMGLYSGISRIFGSKLAPLYSGIKKYVRFGGSTRLVQLMIVECFLRTGLGPLSLHLTLCAALRFYVLNILWHHTIM